MLQEFRYNDDTIQQCSQCYREHPATVDLCDCGHPLESPVQFTWTHWPFLKPYLIPACTYCGEQDARRLGGISDDGHNIAVTWRCNTCRELYTVEHYTTAVYILYSIAAVSGVMLVIGLFERQILLIAFGLFGLRLAATVSRWLLVFSQLKKL